MSSRRKSSGSGRPRCSRRLPARRLPPPVKRSGRLEAPRSGLRIARITQVVQTVATAPTAQTAPNIAPPAAGAPPCPHAPSPLRWRRLSLSTPNRWSASARQSRGRWPGLRMGGSGASPCQLEPGFPRLGERASGRDPAQTRRSAHLRPLRGDCRPGVSPLRPLHPADLGDPRRRVGPGRPALTSSRTSSPSWMRSLPFSRDLRGPPRCGAPRANGWVPTQPGACSAFPPTRSSWMAALHPRAALLWNPRPHTQGEARQRQPQPEETPLVRFRDFLGV